MAISSCTDLSESTENQDIGSESLRMPWNEKVFFLDKQDGWSHVYQVDYDFQGIQGDAILTPFVKVEGGSHLTVSPYVAGTDTRYLTIVNNGRPGKIHFINVNDASDHRVVDLYEHTGAGEKSDEADWNRVNITQVDFDQNNFLFLAGKDGFFRVSGDYMDMNPDVWSGDDDGDVWAIPLASDDGIVMIEEEFEDEEDYFNDSGNDVDQIKFRGGDILFTQSNRETVAFESERLITVTQAHGNSALWVKLQFERGNAVNYNAGHLFKLRPVKKVDDRGGVGKVTGAALIGDNHLITSHHFSDELDVRTLNGELIASPKLVLNDEDLPEDWSYVLNDEGYVEHNWGDMTSVQTFDSDFSVSDRFFPEDVSQRYYPYYEGSRLAEVELYRPGPRVVTNYDVADDNPTVSRESRRNSSNSDIADLRKKPYKFASLGRDNGYMILKFEDQINVTDNTKLQVVETSWNKKPTYEDKDEAYGAYAERASVYVSDFDSRYIGNWANDGANWTKVGDAYISSNLFDLDGIESFRWVKIVDDMSRTPDGFDVNFVATFEAEDDSPNPYCTNEDVLIAQAGVDTKSPVRLTAMGTYVDGDEIGYRWRLRNNTDEERTYTWDLYNQDVTGSVTMPARYELHFSTDIGGTMRIFWDGDQVEVKAHGGETHDISDCD